MLGQDGRELLAKAVTQLMEEHGDHWNELLPETRATLIDVRFVELCMEAEEEDLDHC